MRLIEYANRKMTIDEYVRREICKNAGDDSIIYKKDLQDFCRSLNIKINSKLSKTALLDLILESGLSYEQIAQQFGVGISSQIYQRSFGISHQDVKRLENHGILKVIGSYEFRAFGRYLRAPLYDPYQFARISDDEMHQLLIQHPAKGSHGVN